MTGSLAPNSAIPLGAKRAEDEAGPRTLYIKKPLKNADALREWAKAQGFKTTLPPEDMHVTLAFSKAPVEWGDVTDKSADDLTQDAGREGRAVEPLGDKGAIVLRFDSPALRQRWHQIHAAGAVWDHEGYKPHVTITYDAGDVDLSKVQPYDGPLEFGGEVRAEVDPGWADKVKANHVALDASMAMDRAATRSTAVMASDSPLQIAMDRDSVREKTRDGRLIVKRTNISKANVCPYRGEEIPGWEALGLDKDRVYNLLRDPEELEKAAATSNGLQLLIKHTPVSAKAPHQDKTVGSTGTDAEFDGEYLTNSLFVNVQDAIDGIETGKQRELSPGYHYKPDMTPGKFRGTAFDGVMRDIVFNHVCLVEDGRTGPDVLVADSALKEQDMAKVTRFGVRTLQITAAAIAPLLAMDSKVTLKPDLFRDLSTKNFKDKREALLGGVRIALDGKLRKGIALDATMQDFAKAIDAFNDDMVAGVDEPVPEDKMADVEVGPVEQAKPIAEPGSTYDAEPLKGYLRECGMDEEKIAKCMDMMPKNGMAGDADETPEEKAAREKKEKDAAAAKDSEMKGMVSKPAMDAAISTATAATAKQVRETERGIRVALAEVKPYVGELPATMAFDSASDVYRHVLKIKNVDGAATMHADALLPVVKTLPVIGAKPAAQHESSMAMDASAVGKAKAMAPGLENISTSL